MVFYGDKDKLAVSREGTRIPAAEKPGAAEPGRLPQ